MRSRFSFITLLSLILALTFAGIPSPVYAQVSVASIVPNQVLNNVSTAITITGANFASDSAVLLDGYGALATTFQNASVLVATVPAGTPAGTYTVTVTTGTESVSCTGCLTVFAPTATPPPTATVAPPPFARPQFAVYSSRIAGTVKTNSEVTLKVVMENVGQSTAYNTQAAFTSSDLVPTKTGGIAIVGNIAYDQEVDVSQTFYVSGQISGTRVIVVDMTLTYYDSEGASYSDKFTLSIPVSGTTAPSGPAAPTSTPTGVKSSQLVITGYSSDVEPLQPGAQFGLKLTVQNVGNANAQRITMIVGGGSGGNSGSGTPVPGGVSGGSGDFANFAPVGASNVQSLGDLKAGEQAQAVQSLIVNVSTNPGAYPMRITFSYLNDKNEVVNDEQVITLLVYSLPNVDVSFYRPLDPFFAGQPSALPIQLVNIGKRSAVFGNMKVESAQGIVENGTSLVGSLEAGGYFTLDSMFIPSQPGTATLNFTIDYVDDFNEPRTITKSVEVEVMEAMIDPSLDPSLNGGGTDGMGDGGFPPVEEESVWKKIWRFILGLLGLDSSGPSVTDPGVLPPSESPIVEPIPGKG